MLLKPRAGHLAESEGLFFVVACFRSSGGKNTYLFKLMIESEQLWAELNVQPVKLITVKFVMKMIFFFAVGQLI